MQAAFLFVLVNGLNMRFAGVTPSAMQILDFAVEPPAPEIKPEPPRPSAEKPREEGEGAPPNIVSRATEIAAPPPVLPVLPVMAAAPVPAQGTDASSGAAPVAGPGTGAGGVGDGFGSGRVGDGTGGGGGTVLRLLRGHIDDSDYPRAAADAGQSGTVHMRFTVGVDGRATNCIITRSSGSAALDQTTCSLIQKRFRYAPSRDARGRPYADTVTGEQVWELYDDPEKERRSRPRD
ncbi:MAG: TonB family protein [Pseudomonadota bacterium]